MTPSESLRTPGGDAPGRASPPDGDLHLAAAMARVAQGDAAALASLYDAMAPLVYSLAERLTGDPFRAEEAVLDVFRYVWERAARFDRARGSVRAWLMTITRGRTIDRMRSDEARRRHETALPDSSSRESAFVDPAPALHESLWAAEREERVERALDSLSPEQRRAIDLAYFQGLTHERIAARLNEPLGTVKSRIRRGLLRLHELLETFEEER